MLNAWELKVDTRCSSKLLCASPAVHKARSAANQLECDSGGPAGQTRLWLSLITYNLGNLWRGCPLGPVLPGKIENWSLTSLQQRLVKAGGRLIKHARYYSLMLAERHLTRRLFGSMVRRINALAVATG